MVGVIISGASVFKALYDSAKALKDMNDATVRNSAVIELQEKILAAQEAQTTLIEHVRELEEEMRQLKTWSAEKERYHLAEISIGVFAYIIKPEAQGTEPVHCLCTACYAKGVKAILNCSPASSYGGDVHFTCPSCKAQSNGSMNDPNFPFKIFGA